MKNFRNLLAAGLLMLTAAMQAQQPNYLPVDPEVRVGHLDNGLTYYIRHNEQPKQRCEFHIVQAVGATLEEDNQNGLAHFLEHMCFNGTEHFPGKLIIEYFESQGVTFGGNINAYTSTDQTVYRLSEVPTVREGIVDSALLVLHDWSCAVSLLPEEIDSERGVIREEWRTGNTAARRAYKHAQQILFPGTRYATRDVIGDTAVINNFTYDALRAYYHKWYGPDLQAIVVVGDIDVDVIEGKIKALWGNVPARANRGERPYVQIPDNEEPIVGIYTDPEGQRTSINLIFKHQPLPREARGTMEHYIMDVVNDLVFRMLGERLQEIAMRADAPIVGGMMAYTDYHPTLDVFYNAFVAKQGREKDALALMLTQIEKMRRYGFTQDELDRAKSALSSEMEKQFNERTTTDNMHFVDQCIANYLEGKAMPGIEMEYQMIIRNMLPMLSLDMINQVVPQYVTENNRALCITAPEKPEVVLPTEEEIILALANMPNLEIEAPKATAIDDNLVKKQPKAGKIKKTTHNDSFGTTEWLLSNGVRVILKPTAFKQDEILMNAYSFGGESLVDTKDLYSCEYATLTVDYMGLGDYTMTDLQKALSGKHVSCNMSINTNTESIEGETAVKDLESMLQLVYLGFTAPRRDEEAYQSLMAMLENHLQNKEANPKAIFRDSVTMMSTDHHERTILVDKNTIKNVNLDAVLRIYKARFANPADFTFVFVGNLNPEDKELQRLVCTYLGGLKTNGKREKFVDHGIRAPKGEVKNYFTWPMTTTTASNRIQYTSYDIPYTQKNEVIMSLIGEILGRRYLESIREREGGSYGVGTYGYMQVFPVAKAVLLMQFDTDPDKQERLIQIIHEEVQTIVANGPLAEDLQKDKEALIKAYRENVEKNDWWIQVLGFYCKTGIDGYNGYEELVNSISAEDVKTILSELVKAGNVFEVVMFPEK